MPSSDSLSLRLRLCALTLLRRITRRLIKQKAHDQAFPCGHSPFVACRCTVSGSISLPLPGFFSPFPHGTGSLSVDNEYLALEDGPPIFGQDFTCPALLVPRLVPPLPFRIRGCHPLWPDFPDRSAREMAKSRRLFRFRSPLLSESRLISLPLPTEMFQFRRFASLTLWIRMRIVLADGVSPFGNPRIKARL